MAWKYSDENHGMNIFRPKYWRENYPDQNMAWKYSAQTARCQNNDNRWREILKPIFLREYFQTKLLQ
jgi:hypothetical protein